MRIPLAAFALSLTALGAPVLAAPLADGPVASAGAASAASPSAAPDPTVQQIQDWIGADDTAAPPADLKARRPVHGSVYVAAGTGGYRAAGGTIEAQIGDKATVAVAVETVQGARRR